MSDVLSMMSKQFSDSMGTLNPRSLKDIIDVEALSYAIYTVEGRAIPNMIDGFKPVHRFVMARALDLARGDKNKFHKVASIAGGVADYGYHHGEASAEEATSGLVATYKNEYPMFDGQGNFGSRMVPEASSARYVFARVSKNFYNLFKDTEYAPVHPDEEHKPPAFYLPVIPTVLLNATSGIAVGFATDILPHSFQDVKEAVKAIVEGREPVTPKVKYPEFRGEVVELEEPGKYELHGTYKMTSRTQMEITEIPVQWNLEKYTSKILDPLEEKGFITWKDNCGEHGFGFKIKFRKEYKLDGTEEENHEKIMKDFGLIEKLSQNLTVLNHKGKLAEYTNTLDLIRDFVDVRKTYVQVRIDSKIKETEAAFKLARAKVFFIKEVIDGKVVIQGKPRKKLIEELQASEIYGDYAEKLVAMNIYHMTSDEAKKLADEAKAKKAEHEYWKTTDVKTEYLNDLEAL